MFSRKPVLLSLALLALFAGAPFSANAARATRKVELKASGRFTAVCRATRGLRAGEIWKSVASRHIPDRRKYSTSFITLRSTGAPRNNCLNVYDGAGNLVHKLGRYFPTGAAYSSRFYGGHGCGDGKSAATVAAMARRNTGKTTVYVTSGTGVCAIIPNPATCFNSSAC